MGRRLLLVGECLVGGLGAVVIEQASWFTERGWDVTVAAPPDPEQRWSRLDASYVPLALPGSTRDVVPMLRATQTLRALVRDLRPAVVHAHGVRPFVATRLATGRPPYVTLHAIGRIADDPPGYRFVRGAGLSVVPRLARRAFTAAPGVGHGWQFLLHTSPLLPALGPDPMPFPAADTVPTFLWLARLDSRKPGDVFVRAVAELAAERPVRGVVAGDGPLVDALAALVAELDAPVELVGFRPPAPLLAEAWALALFSSQEAVTFAVQEAMWAGRAAVCSPLPGLRWLAGETAVYADDVAGATAALRRLCDHDAAAMLGARAATRAREVIEPGSTWPVTEQAYLDDLGARR